MGHHPSPCSYRPNDSVARRRVVILRRRRRCHGCCSHRENALRSKHDGGHALSRGRSIGSGCRGDEVVSNHELYKVRHIVAGITLLGKLNDLHSMMLVMMWLMCAELAAAHVVSTQKI